MTPEIALMILLWLVAVTLGFLIDAVRNLRRRLDGLLADLRAAEADIRRLTPPPPCRCGEMVAGRVEQCLRHPGVRVRTREEKSTFAKAFDAGVTGKQKP